MPIYKDEKRKTWYISEYINKKRVVRRGFKKNKDAKDALDLIKTQKIGICKKTTVDDVYALFLEQYKLNNKGASILTMKYVCDTHVKGYFDKPIDKINSFDIMEWKNDLSKKGLKIGTQNAYFAKLKLIFKFAVNHLELQTNPCDKVPKLKDNAIVKQDYKLITFDDFFKSVELVDDQIYKTMFKVLFLEGMRVGELLALQVKDINFNFNKITINKTYSKLQDGSKGIVSPKNKYSNRIIDMFNPTKELLKTHIRKNDLKDDDFLFFGSTPINALSVWYFFKKYFPNNTTHNLRHSHISWLLYLGVNMLSIADRVGHKDTSMIQNIYSHLYEDTKKQTLNLVNESFRDTNMIRKKKKNNPK